MGVGRLESRAGNMGVGRLESRAGNTGVGRLERQAGEVQRGSAVTPPPSGTTSPETLLSSYPSLFHCAHPSRLYLLAVLDDVGCLQVLLTHLLAKHGNRLLLS